MFSAGTAEFLYVVQGKCRIFFSYFILLKSFGQILREVGETSTRIINLVENHNKDVYYTGRGENPDTDTVTGLIARDLPAFDKEMYTSISIYNGYIVELVTGDELITSECRWIEQ